MVEWKLKVFRQVFLIFNVHFSGLNVFTLNLHIENQKLKILRKVFFTSSMFPLENFRGILTYLIPILYIED